MKNYLSEDVKNIILSKIFESNYREVMKRYLNGMSKDDIAYDVGYSVRQIERIISLCWREACIRLAQKELEK